MPIGRLDYRQASHPSAPNRASPAPLEYIKLELRDSTPNDGHIDAACKRSKQMLPRLVGESRRLSYSDAILQIEKTSGLFNGIVYRPMQIEVAEHLMHVTFTRGRYFDYLDTGEVLAYEIGLRHLRQARRVTEGSYRRSLGNPFDLYRRGASFGIITLTIRQGTDKASFYMHQRNGDHVVAGSEIMHVIPAGEFDDVFADIVRVNNEGTVLIGDGSGLPFNTETSSCIPTISTRAVLAETCLGIGWLGVSIRAGTRLEIAPLSGRLEARHSWPHPMCPNRPRQRFAKSRRRTVDRVGL